ncbi:hypothetical protein N0Y54_14945 [Nostoc punctiforme UO1]|uniref:hypothetical protein n=1 Tax=Nostoc punctiforme TaxID=272131 RepID=UPI0030981036
MDKLAEKFNDWAKNYVEIEESEWCALDGKSIKGTVKNYNSSQQNFVSIVSVFACKRGLVVGSQQWIYKVWTSALIPYIAKTNL